MPPSSTQCAPHKKSDFKEEIVATIFNLINNAAIIVSKYECC